VTDLAVHPVADLFPMLPDDELSDLAADIKANGLQSPIVVKDGVLIDGRNRLAACELAGVEPAFVDLNGSDPVAFILSANLARRHMTKGQRAMAAARVLPEVTTRDAGSVVGVSNKTVSQARQVLAADSDLADQVLAGTISLNDAHSTVQTRKRETDLIARQRQELRDLAPDLEDEVADDVISLAAALREAEDRSARRQSELKAAHSNLRSVLTYLTSEALSAADLAATYVEVAPQFDQADLDQAAETMRHIAQLRKDA
jgi:ParB-like chromosome segregation protein Spo0J